MVNLFNPEMIIVGGGMSAAGDRLLNTVRDTVENHALTLSNFSTVCVVPRESIQLDSSIIRMGFYSLLRMAAIFTWRDACPPLELAAEMRISLIPQHHRNMVYVQVGLL